MAEKVIETRITSVERLGTSYYGNPYYRVFITDEPYVLRTSIDSGLNYGITNSSVTAGPVRLHLTKAGRIWKLETSDGGQL